MSEHAKDVTAAFKGSSSKHIIESRDRIINCINRLGNEKMWWRPNEKTTSCGILVKHLCGNISQYLLSALGNRPDGRIRDEEFTDTQEHGEELLQRLEEIIDSAIHIISTMTEHDLLKSYQVQGFSLNGTEIVQHVVEHLSYHTGQIAWITKMLTEEDLGFYEGQDLNIRNE